MAMLLIFGLVLTGLVALAIAMPRHQRQLLPARPPLTVALALACRIGGALLLLFSLLVALRALGGGIGAVAWFGLLTVAIALLALLFAYAPRKVLAITVIALLAALAAIWVGWAA